MTAKKELGVEAIAPTSPNLIQAKNFSQYQLQKITLPQVEKSADNPANFTAKTEGETDAIAPTSSSDTISQTNLIQTRLDNPSLNLLKPLGTSKPLDQASDLVLSDFVADHADKTA